MYGEYFVLDDMDVLSFERSQCHEEESTQPDAVCDDRLSDYVLSRYGVWLKKNWSDATFNFCYRGAYSPLLSDYLAAQDTDFIFIDIGANQGLYTLLAAQNEHCKAVFAFEPVRKTFDYLTSNIQVNSAQSDIKAFCTAISSRKGVESICLKPGHSGAASMRPSAQSLLKSVERVSTIGPAELRLLVPASPSIIKVDVEGHEEVVILALSESGHLRHARAVCYEVDERWSNAENLQRMLRTQGFNHFARTATGRHYDVLASRR